MGLLSPLSRMSGCRWRVGGLKDISMLGVDCMGNNSRKLWLDRTGNQLPENKATISEDTSFRDTQHLSPILSGRLPLMPMPTT